MKQVIVVLALAVAGAAHAEPLAVPELDPGRAIVAVTLLCGFALVLRAARRRTR
jgi:hypothetical protein